MFTQTLVDELTVHPPPPPPPEGQFMLPWAFGLWGALGEIGDAIEALYSDEAQNYVVANLTHFNWYPGLLFVSTFVLTVFLVNLMIAKMTSTYEHIKDNAAYYKAQDHLELVKEFKDERGPPPPFNLLGLAVDLLSLCYDVRRALGLAPPEQSSAGYKVGMNKTAADYVRSHERIYRSKFYRRLVQAQAGKQDRQVKELHACVPVVQQLDARSKQLVSEIESLKGLQDQVRSKVDSNDLSVADLKSQLKRSFSAPCSSAAKMPADNRRHSGMHFSPHQNQRAESNGLTDHSGMHTRHASQENNGLTGPLVDRDSRDGNCCASCPLPATITADVLACVRSRSKPRASTTLSRLAAPYSVECPFNLADGSVRGTKWVSASIL